MRTQSTDTPPEVERVQIELLRKAGLARRAELTRSLSRTTIEFAWQAIEDANPGASPDEIAVIFVAVHYGKELTARYAQHLARRRG